MTIREEQASVYVPHRRTMLRSLLILAGGSTVTGLQGCAWISGDKYRSERFSDSTEEISSVLISADGQHLVFLTKQSHYIFDAPASLVAALRSSYKPNLAATIGKLNVDVDGKAKVAYQIDLVNPSSTQSRQARLDGFDEGASGFRLKGALQGMRYASNGATLKQTISLNKTYRVEVHRELRGYEYVDLPSPIRATAEGGLAIVMAPLAIVVSIALLPVLIVFLPVIAEGGSLGVGP